MLTFKTQLILPVHVYMNVQDITEEWIESDIDRQINRQLTYVNQSQSIANKFILHVHEAQYTSVC